MTGAESTRIAAGPLDTPDPAHDHAGAGAGAPAGGRAPASWTYLPALDGVRALAVIAVVLFHYWPDLFPGGFVGVDVFFAMSGFLITGILLSEYRRSGGIDLRAFWGRRIRRLVPAVVVLVVVTAVATAATGSASSRQLADSIGALTWSTNIVEAWFGGSRIWMHNPRTTLDHLWSLAIEEQFYLVWPLVAGLILRRARSRGDRVAMVVVLAAASATAMWFVGGIHAYFRTDTRAFELLAGAALAMSGIAVVRRLPSAGSTALAVSGLVGLGLFVGLGDPNAGWMFPWGFLLVSLCSLALVVAAADPPAWLGAALAWGPLRHLGQVSYGVYLWHIPVLRLLSAGRTGLDGIALTAVRLVVVAVVVEVSYRFVEEPFRRGRLPFRLPQFGAAYAVAALALLLLIPQARRDAEGQWDPIDGPPRVAAGERRILVVGDLYGAALVANLSTDDGVWSLADPGCPRLLGSGLERGSVLTDDDGRPFEPADGPYCEHWQQRWTRAVERFRPDAVLVASGYWDTLPVERDGRIVDGAALQQLYDDLVAAQVRTLTDAGVAPERITLASLSHWDDIVDRSQVSLLDDRSASVAAYDEAVAAAVERLGVGVVEGRRDADGVVEALRTRAATSQR